MVIQVLAHARDSILILAGLLRAMFFFFEFNATIVTSVTFMDTSLDQPLTSDCRPKTGFKLACNSDTATSTAKMIRMGTWKPYP